MEENQNIYVQTNIVICVQNMFAKIIYATYIENPEYPKYKKPMKYIFYDFECMQDTGIHVPNYW